jgi:D-beta-D-heptose 7-phosphate kinase/D-beta-D-heptose 1-phosphate adenosyltransferase
MTLSNERARELLAVFPDQKILVVGDLMLDRYVYGAVERISPEAPVPVVHVHRDFEVPGGACNVATNIRALGGECALAGLVGADTYGDHLLSLLGEAGVDIEAVVQSADTVTTVKSRVVADGQHVVRVDREDFMGEDICGSEEFLNHLRNASDDASGVIIEDYGKGVVFQSVVDIAIAAARERGIPCGLDPKDNYELKLDGITLVKPNRAEAFNAVGRIDQGKQKDVEQDEALNEVGQALMERWSPEFLLMTLGDKGMMVFQKGAERHHVDTRAKEVFDVSGAGDTVIATCLLALAAGATPVEAAELANYAAGVVVGKLGTVTCTPDELLKSMV